MPGPETVCVGCRARGVQTSRRPAPHPGPRCASCHREVTGQRRERSRDLLRERRYGITPDQHAALLEVQGGVCAICTRATGRTRALSVDHDHKREAEGYGFPSVVRGLLCRPCNDLLGQVHDDPTVLLRAVDYLLHPPARKVIP